VQHNNGVGSTFFDCIPAGSYSQQLATDAANAWATSATNDIFSVCQGCLARQVTSLNGGGSACGVWCYDGSFGNPVGGVLVTQSFLCTCPTTPYVWQ